MIMPLFDINWQSESAPRWQQIFAQTRRAPVLQSPAYARAMTAFQGLKPRRGIIQANGAEAGIVQVLETGLFGNLIHGVMLDLGPLWCEGFGGAFHQKLFWETLNREFPPRLGRKRRIIPNLFDTPMSTEMLRSSGLKRGSQSGYQTIWLDLEPEPEELRAGLKSSWRGALVKAERSNMAVEWDENLEHFPAFARQYTADKAARGYHGVSPKLLEALAESFAADGGLLIGRAMLDNETVASILILCHGRSATYQVGWTSDKGRQNSAHHLLLWQALSRLQERGVRDFDLGGVNGETAQGVKTFKEGLGGELVHLAGIYN